MTGAPSSLLPSPNPKVVTVFLGAASRRCWMRKLVWWLHCISLGIPCKSLHPSEGQSLTRQPRGYSHDNGGSSPCSCFGHSARCDFSVPNDALGRASVVLCCCNPFRACSRDSSASALVHQVADRAESRCNGLFGHFTFLLGAPVLTRIDLTISSFVNHIGNQAFGKTHLTLSISYFSLLYSFVCNYASPEDQACTSGI